MPWIARSWADLVVLDPRLPEDAGTCFFRQLRTLSNVPVVMISPRADEHERIWGLQLGADDFVPNPLTPDELVARVRGVLRRSPRRGDAWAVSPPATGPLLLDEAGRRVRVRDVWVVLTALEFRLLAFLSDNPGCAFSREHLLEAVWGYTIGDTSTVTVHVRRLREKIERNPARPMSIVTVWGVGYRFDSSTARPS